MESVKIPIHRIENYTDAHRLGVCNVPVIKRNDSLVSHFNGTLMIVEINKTTDKHIIKYCKSSRPKIGWEGEKDPNHFQLFEKIYKNEYFISSNEIKSLLLQPVLDKMLQEIRCNFLPLMSVNRVTMISKCLEYRFNKMRSLL